MDRHDHDEDGKTKAIYVFYLNEVEEEAKLFHDELVDLIEKNTIDDKSIKMKIPVHAVYALMAR